MSATTSLAGNDLDLSLEDAVFAALSPDGAHALSVAQADAGVDHEYTALDVGTDYDSGMMGAATGAAQAPGQRQAAQGHAVGRQGLGQLNHGVLSVAGTMLNEAGPLEAGDSGVGHLVLGGATDNAEKKPGVATNASGTEESWQALHHEVEVAIRTEPAVDSGHPAAPATAAGEEPAWDFIHEIPHPEGVHKIAPIADSVHEASAGEAAAQLFAGNDGFGDIAAPLQPAANPVQIETPASDPAATDIGSTLGGKVEPGAKVSLYDNGALVDTVQADADGNWGASPQLGEGAHQLTAMAADSSGNLAVASNVTIVVAEQAEQTSDNVSLAAASDFNAGLVPEAMQGHDFVVDFDALSVMLSAASAAADDVTQQSVVSGYAPFALPAEDKMQVDDAGDSSVMKLDGANLTLNDVLEQGGKLLFADDGVATHGNAGATLGLDDVLAGGSAGDGGTHAADVLDGETYSSSYQPVAHGLEWLQQYGAENQPA